MKLTKTQIILASAGAVVAGAAIFFGLTKTGKGLVQKWFGKKETVEMAEDTKADTPKSDIPPEDKGIVPSKPQAPPPPKTELKREFPLGTWSMGSKVESVQKALNKFYKFTLPINGKMDNDTINSLTSRGYTVPLSKQQFNRLIVGLK